MNLRDFMDKWGDKLPKTIEKLILDAPAFDGDKLLARELGAAMADFESLKRVSERQRQLESDRT